MLQQQATPNTDIVAMENLAAAAATAATPTPPAQVAGAAKEIMRVANTPLQTITPAPRQQADRQAERSKEMAAWFGIPETETLVNDFHCALRKRVLLQGRLFVFEHYVCFSTNVFGYVKKIALPLSEVQSICKKTYFKFPNSIEVEDCQGERSFFTSFLTRESAFRTIVNAWAQICPDLAEPLLAALEEDNGGPAAANGAGAGAGAGLGAGIGALSNAAPAKKLSMLFFNKKKKQDPLLLEPGCEPEPEQCQLQAAVEANGGGVERISAPDEVHSLADGLQRRLSLTFMDGNLDDPNRCSEEVWSCISQASPPALPKHAKLLHSVTLPGSPRDFFELLVADDSPFMEDVLLQLGNRNIDIATWKPADQLGHIRNVQFVNPIKGAFSSWGVPTTRCYVTQRFCRYSNDHLLFEASQINLDIPYGDTFTVDITWHVDPDPSSTPEEPRSNVTLHVVTPFSRSCLFRKIIENGVFTQSKESYQFVLKEASGELQRRLNSRRLRSSNRFSPAPAASPGQPEGAAAPGLAAASRGLAAESVAPGGHGLGRSTGSRRGFAREASVPRAAGRERQPPGGSAWLTWLAVLLLLVMCCLQVYVLVELRARGGLPGAGPGTAAEPDSDGGVGVPAQERALQQLQQLVQELGAMQQRAAAAAAEVRGLVKLLALAPEQEPVFQSM